MHPSDKKPAPATENNPPTDVPANTAGGNTNADENVFKAHEQAEKDIEQDPEISAHSPNDDLDEGELARLGEDNTDIV